MHPPPHHHRVTSAYPSGAPSHAEAAADGRRGATRHFLVGLARAIGGAVIFALPLFMTMEMWWLGFYMDRVRFALFLAANLPLLVGLSHVSGFEETFEPVQDVVDALVAYAVGFATGAIGLALFGVLLPGMSWSEIVGKVAIVAVPGSIGALLAQSQFGGHAAEERAETDGTFGYGWQLFLMAAGALFLAFNLAPTEEMVLIAYRMTTWHALALVAVSLAGMHAFVYAMEFRGQESVAPGTPRWSPFLRFTVAGYALALAVSAYVLWSFGRLDDTRLAHAVGIVVVLGFPAAVGAAAARLLL